MQKLTTTLHICVFISVLCFLGNFSGQAFAAEESLYTLDQSRAVVLAYYRVGEDYAPESSISTTLFKNHIEYIIGQKYAVLSPDQLFQAYEDKSPLPENAIILTFNGAYQSTLRNAVPVLLENRLPFTIFYASSLIGSTGYMNWDDLENLHQNPLVTLATFPAHHAHMPHDASQSSIQTDINKAKIAYRDHFDEEPRFFAYPYGEFTHDYSIIVSKSGYKAAFGLHSGPIYAETDPFGIPRFVLTDQYGSLEHLRMITNMLPLPTKNLTPQATISNSIATAAPLIGFTIHPELSKRLDTLKCFTSEEHNKPKIEKIGNTRVEIRLDHPPTRGGKIRMNCTIPYTQHIQDDENAEPRWRWLGMMIINPHP